VQRHYGKQPEHIPVFQNAPVKIPRPLDGLPTDSIIVEQTNESILRSSVRKETTSRHEAETIELLKNAVNATVVAFASRDNRQAVSNEIGARLLSFHASSELK
jgi:hypothetical protein